MQTMNFSLNLLLLVVLLMPGFLYLAYMLLFRRGPLSQSLPSSGSLIVLVVVPLVSLAAHAVWAGLFWMQELYCGVASCRALPFDPNIYKLLFSERASLALPSSGIFYVLMTALAIALSTVVATVCGQGAGRVCAWAWYGARGRLSGQARHTMTPPQRPHEDWLSYLVRASRPDEVVLVAYVLTHQVENGLSVGYFGNVEEVRRDPETGIAFIVLSQFRTFLVEAETLEEGLADISYLPEAEISFGPFVIQSDEIRNVEFELFKKDMDDEDDDSMGDDTLNGPAAGPSDEGVDPDTPDDTPSPPRTSA